MIEGVLVPPETRPAASRRAGAARVGRVGRAARVALAVAALAVGCRSQVPEPAPTPPPAAPPAAPPWNPPSADPSAPVLIRFEPASIDLGTIYYGPPVKTAATATNISGSDVLIADLKTSCGCTMAKIRTQDGTEIVAKAHPLGRLPDQPMVTLHPGDSLSLDIELAPPAAMKGPITKEVQFLFMDPKQPMAELTIHADVQLAYRVDPEFMNVGNVRKSGLVERTFTVTSELEGTWDITGFEAGTPGETLPPGMKFEVLDHEGGTRRVRMLWDGPRAVGSATVKIRVLIDGPAVPYADVATWGAVGSDIVVDNKGREPGQLNFDRIPVGGSATRTVVVTNMNPDVPYVLETIDIKSTRPQFIKVVPRVIQPGVLYEIDVTADAGIGEKLFRGQLVLHAQYPDDPARVVNFVGAVDLK